MGTTPASGLALGQFHTCALTRFGGVRCWGEAENGQLGYGNVIDIGDDETPASVGDVPLGARATHIAAGAAHSCAILETGAVRCWGANTGGALGYGVAGTIGDDETPASRGDVPLGGARAIQISAGGYSTCVILEGGAVRCWGAGTSGQLGQGNTNNIGDDEPASAVGVVELGAPATQIDLGVSHACALLGTGDVRCWGAGIEGQLGYGNVANIGDDETPASIATVALGGKALQLAVGAHHTCVILEGGDVRCWGEAEGGRLGYGNLTNIGDDETPASIGTVVIGGPVIHLGLGFSQSCAVLATGAVRCWGSGALGYGMGFLQIGDDEVPATAGDVPLGTTATAIAAGNVHTCAIVEGGAIRCWGSGGFGELGYGNGMSVGQTTTPASAGDVPFE